MNKFASLTDENRAGQTDGDDIFGKLMNVSNLSFQMEFRWKIQTFRFQLKRTLFLRVYIKRQANRENCNLNNITFHYTHNNVV